MGLTNRFHNHVPGWIFREYPPVVAYTCGQAIADPPLHAMAQHVPIRRVPPASDIPDKLYFRIGDVAKLCEVPAYVLRFWESEFPQLKPNKGGTGQRLYRRKDVETALSIKRLLYDEGYTIAGARQIFKLEQRGAAGPQLALAIEASEPLLKKDVRRLQSLRKELQDLYAVLSSPVRTEKASRVRPFHDDTASRGIRALKLTSHVAMEDLFDR